MKLTKPSIEKQRLYLIVLIGFILRLIAIPFSQVVDADVLSRIFASENWLESPHLIYEGIWPPLHFYFNAIAIAVFGEHVVGPILFHSILACLTAIPLYHFTKREFSEEGAWFSAAFYLLCPVVFRNSFHALSEIPHAFFVAMAMNCISKSIRNKDVKQAVYAGLYMTIASGFRYEAWLLIALFTGVFLLFKAWKHTVYFWVASMIFPAFWMVGNYIAHEDFLFGLSGAYHWNIIMEGVNDHVDLLVKIKRLIYFPLSWLFLFSPVIAGLVGWKMIQKLKNKELIKSRIIWSIPFWIVFVIFIFKGFEGTLLLQHRFTILLILLSAPFTSIIIEKIKWNTTKKVGVVFLLASLLPMSYFWMYVPFEKLFKFSNTLNTAFYETRASSHDKLDAIPKLSNQNYVVYSKKINKELTKKSGLIIDFVSWDNTFFLAMQSQLRPKQVFIVDGSKHGQVYEKELQKTLKDYPSGIILLKCFSKFSNNYTINNDIITFKLGVPFYLKLTPIDGEIGVGIFKYEVVNSSETKQSSQCFVCPELNSLEYFILKIKDDDAWLNNIRVSARKDGVSVEQKLIENAQWMVDNI